MGKKAAPGSVPDAPAEELPVEEEPPGEQLEGDFVFPDGSEYRGQYFKKGERVSLHGEGRLQNGSEIFQGLFENGLYKNGKYTTCGGAIYSGWFRNNLFHGPGEYLWPDGRKYSGMWKEGTMHGDGRFEQFGVGIDKEVKGFCVSGRFASGAKEQEQAKRDFLQEYGADYVGSATTFLLDILEKLGVGDADAKDKKAAKKGAEVVEDMPPEVAAALFVPSAEAATENEGPSLAGEIASIEEVSMGPYPEVAAIKPSSLREFCELFAEGSETPGTACIVDKRVGPAASKLTKEQLQHIGQAVELIAPAGGEVGSISRFVLVNVTPEYDAAAARWKLLHFDSVADAGE